MTTTPSFSDKLDEILVTCLNEFYDYITEKDIVKVADEYSNKTIPKKAKASLIALIEKEIIGPNENLVLPDFPKFDEEGEPLYSKRAAAEGRKQVIARYTTRNSLRAEQRNKLKGEKP